ncbi:MAG: dihydropteroate synthase [Francisellaceae bacterium]|jgi:dihydropteroate synthase|nr:dihydropteroate synthase [Francisellaceae bacterium]MBT6207554.1 dihydropteroate synthase [Francisellaceae bacterium]MBT6538821.1 dihydropteroate synthase [Francisellaceae bacterium]
MSQRKIFAHGRPTVMGILNITENSFYQGAMFIDHDKAFDHAMSIIDEGADIIDIGGESTNPFNLQKISQDQELDRVIPVIERIRANSEITISIDTSKPAVMDSAICAGADMVNDVRGLTKEGAIDIVASTGVHACIMHMQGEPETMQTKPCYENVTSEVFNFLSGRVDACLKAGIDHDKIIIDPGFCFGKTHENNIELLRNVKTFKDLGLPLLAGLSRKSMIGKILDAPLEDRLSGSITMAILLAQQGVNIIRVHDVKETVQALRVLGAIEMRFKELFNDY